MTRSQSGRVSRGRSIASRSLARRMVLIDSVLRIVEAESSFNGTKTKACTNVNVSCQTKVCALDLFVKPAVPYHSKA